MVKKHEIDIDTVLDTIEHIGLEDNTKTLLDNGIPTYIKEPNMPQGTMIKLYPNGTRDTIIVDENFQERIVTL